MKRGRGDFFLSLTLNDFVLTLLFLILLLCLGSLLRVAREKKECEDRSERCDPARVQQLENQVAVIRSLLEKAGRDPSEVERLVLVALQDANRIGDLENVRRDLERKEGELLGRIEELERILAAVTPPLGLDGKAVDYPEMQVRLDQCSERMKECGLGQLPCWTDALGKVEYLYTVTIHETGVSAAPRWPTGRTADVLAIPGATALPGSNMSLAEFGRRAGPILTWSKQQKPECRHYAYVVDEAETKKAFKDNLFAIEDSFYKYVERRAPSGQSPALAPVISEP